MARFVTFTPSTIRLRGAQGTPVTASLHIRPEAAYPFRITHAAAKSGKNYSFTVTPEKDGYRIDAKNTRKTPGNYVDILTFTTDSPIRKELQVRVFGNIRPQPAEKEK